MTARDGTSDRSVVALIGAAILVIVVIAVVLLFGIARPPELASLIVQPEPQPPARVAWTSFEDGEDCLHVAHPDGTIERLRCVADGLEIWAWPEAGVELRTFGPAGPQRLLVDPGSGEVVERGDVDDTAQRPQPRVEGIRSRFDHGTLIVTREGTDQVVWEVDAPEAYRVQQGTSSPDGDWIAMVDSADRLLVVPADGSHEPRVWVEEAPSWQPPIWEGTEPPGP